MFPYSQPKATIQAGQSLSNCVYIGAGEIVAVEMPAAWDAAAITFQASVDGVNYFNLVDDAGNEVKLVASAGNHVAIGEGTAAKAEQFRGAVYVMVRSGTAAAPVAQTANRTVTLVARKMLPVTRV